MMSRFTISLFFAFLAIGFCALIIPAHAGPQDFSELNQLSQDAYQASVESRWDDAIEKYEQLVDLGRTDPMLYYNLGTAYAKAGDEGLAIANLVRAKRLSPRNGDIRTNLRILAPEISSQMAMLPVPPLQGLYEAASLNEWAWFALINSLLAGSIYMFRLFSSAPGRLSRKAMLTTMFLAIVAHSFAGLKYYEEKYTARGIVVAEEMLLHTGPSADADLLQTVLPAGTPLRVRGAGVSGWLSATPIAGENYTVYVKSDDVEIL